MAYRSDSLEKEGLKKRLKKHDIDFIEFITYVDRGATPSRLLEIYEGRINNWRTIIKFLEQLARERGFDSYHDLYV